MNDIAAASRWWHPVAGVDEFVGAGPLPVRLLGQDLVLWRTGPGAGSGSPSGSLSDSPIHAFDDRCPHRGARLSLGRVVTCPTGEPQLQCAYHGWCFDGAGACRRIPALPGFVPPAGHGLTPRADDGSSQALPWQVAVAHGLIWLARDPLHPAPPACEGVPERRVVCGPYIVETSAPRVVENFLDTSHFAFVHEGWLGDTAHPEVPPYPVEATADGRPLIPRYRAWQPRASASSAQGAWVDYRYEVLSPYTALLQKQPEGDGVADAYTAFACPLDEERTRVWFMQYTSDTATPDAELQSFQDTIFGQDAPVLESQRPKRLPLAGGEVHSAADRLSAAYRRWLSAQAVGFGTC